MVKGSYQKMFTLQWHITAKCDQKCKHCYMYKSKTYKSEIKNELKTEECKKVIDDFAKTVKQWGITGRISFVGGDPLLRKDLLQLIKYSKQKNLKVVILGNPYHITPSKAKALKKLGVNSYQISLDGLEKTHDYFRRKNSFQESIKAIKTLKQNKIRTTVMFTLSPKNSAELIPLIRLVSKLGVDEFDFNRLVPIGNGTSMKKQQFTPKQYRKLLLKVHKEYETLRKKGTKTKFGSKDNLWKLLFYEMGIVQKPEVANKYNVGGCAMGLNCLSLLADGQVYMCRRIPESIGRVPQKSIQQIFIHSKRLDKIRQAKNYEKCSKCELGKVCRGCPAISKAVNGSYFSPDPQCWKKN